MRGKLWCPRWRSCPARFIPAHAGKTARTSAIRAAGGVHPRACGENPYSAGLKMRRPGSSPRMRGKRRGRCYSQQGRRFIPAHAGKTRGGIVALGGRWVHPRACGENPPRPFWSSTPRGSSPRMRGKLADRVLLAGDGGFIPAHAGKTSSRQSAPLSGWVHPRACGENPEDWEALESWGGSSPRMRGKHLLTWAFTAQAGRILETLGLSSSSGSYSFPGVRASAGRHRARRRGPCTGPVLGRPPGAS